MKVWSKKNQQQKFSSLTKKKLPYYCKLCKFKSMSTGSPHVKHFVLLELDHKIIGSN